MMENTSADLMFAFRDHEEFYEQQTALVERTLVRNFNATGQEDLILKDTDGVFNTENFSAESLSSIAIKGVTT
jgi:hypothetical protein